MQLNRNEKAYRMMKTYAESVGETMQEYYKRSDYTSFSQFYKDFVKFIDNETLAQSSFMRWFDGVSTPNIYYAVQLAEFMHIDVYDLLYHREESGEQ